MNLALFLAVVVAHELGHATAAALLGLRPRPRVSWRRVAIRVEISNGRIRPESDLLISLAGPCVGVMIAVPLLTLGQTAAAWFSVALALESLLPIRILGVAQDGFRARNAIRELRQ